MLRKKTLSSLFGGSIASGVIEWTSAESTTPSCQAGARKLSTFMLYGARRSLTHARSSSGAPASWPSSSLNWYFCKRPQTRASGHFGFWPVTRSIYEIRNCVFVDQKKWILEPFGCHPLNLTFSVFINSKAMFTFSMWCMFIFGFWLHLIVLPERTS